jgi:hypothetical protein
MERVRHRLLPHTAARPAIPGLVGHAACKLLDVYHGADPGIVCEPSVYPRRLLCALFYLSLKKSDLISEKKLTIRSV